ncbi:MAG: aldo/keto reductase [Bdellovibrionota bacterium]|nr:aldo/keto reductase [Deltaproteobacteria bacterium]
MEYRKLGRSGLKISAVSLGSWLTFGRIEDSVAKDLMATAYEAGINFFDNAEVYMAGQSEIVMGKILKELNFGRDTYCVSSKVFWGGDKPTQLGLSRKHIMEACHAALKRLQVEYLDLYFCHRPDPETPMQEIVRSMNILIEQGKVFYWGTSEWSGEQLDEAFTVSEQLGLIPPTMEQPQYNMFHRYKMETEFSHLFKEKGLGTTIWSPLASGVLTGKYFDDEVPSDSRFANQANKTFRERGIESESGKQNLIKAKKLKTIADELDITLAQFALAWCLKNHNVSTVILGASKQYQLEENIKSLAHVVKLDEEVLSKVEKILAA